MSDQNSGMTYIPAILPDGTVQQQVVDRGQHLCTEIYVSAKRMGTITDDEELPEGDCSPVHDTSFVDMSNT